MANFQQHLSCSTATGVALGVGGWLSGVPIPSALVAGGLCSLAGMFPDIDSKTSRSYQECVWAAAGIAAVSIVLRLAELHVSKEIAFIFGVGTFLLFRNGVGHLLRKFTTHRGMFHSIPMAVLAGELGFLLSNGDTYLRIFKGFSLFAGFLSHLILDECFSVDSTGREFKIKKSFGTALKVIDYENRIPTFATYAVLFVVTCVVTNEPYWVEKWNARSTVRKEKLEEIINKLHVSEEERTDGLPKYWIGPTWESVADSATEPTEPKKPERRTPRSLF